MRVSFNVSNRTLALVAGGSICFTTGAVIATEFPTESSALVYAGRLTDSAGNPRTTTESVNVTLFSAESGGLTLCAGSEAAVNFRESQGHFRVDLPELCADAIATHGDVWAQVTVGSTTLPRQKLGAVPFAIAAHESQHSDLADLATVAGAVENGGVDTAALQDGAVLVDKLDPAFVASVEDLDSRLLTLERRLNNPVQGEHGGGYSTNAIYRGKTAPTGAIFTANRNGVALTGYRAAKYLCEQAVGSLTAHMCTAEEAARSAQVGVVPAQAGWISTGTSSERERDCVGWTRNNTDDRGVVWPDGTYAAGAWPYVCNQTFSIQCCD